MTNLTGRGPLGLKDRKDPPPLKKPWQSKRKPIPPRSKKKLAYLRSPDRKAGMLHMARVAELPCMVCGAWHVEVHHDGFPRSDMNVLALCPKHHRREFGPGAYHYSPRAFYEAHGTSAELLERVQIMLANGTEGDYI